MNAHHPHNAQPNPLKNLQFQGLHLIEASAGTGKTFTLANLMVRILVEQHMPRQVIATTFTRKAAAELKSRIRQYLQDALATAKVWLQAKAQGNEPKLSGEIDQILYDKYAKTVAVQEQDLNYLINRLQLVLDSLDEMFVGTIDSFVQKILREFAFESGEFIQRELVEDEAHYPYQLTHDLLRAWLQQQPQSVVDSLILTHKAQSVEHYTYLISQSLNFPNSYIPVIECPQIDFDAIIGQLERLVAAYQREYDQLKPYYDADAKPYNDIFNGTSSSLKKRIAIFEQRLPRLMELLPKIKRNPALYFAEQTEQLIYAICSLFLKSDKTTRFDSIFKKNNRPDLVQHFEQLDTIKQIDALITSHQMSIQNIDQYAEFIRYYLITEVRQRLPHTLLQAGETMFNQQTQSLAMALNRPQADSMAYAILQRYPLILVDEFQDTNDSQDYILTKIWRNALWLSKGCFIAVGDPKQAIYGFRGGDVLTYNNAKKDILSKGGTLYRLAHNFRSIQPLVEQLNHLFNNNPDFGEDIHYFDAEIDPESSGTACHRLYEVIDHQATAIAQPLQFMQLSADQKASEAECIAQHMVELMQKADANQLYIGSDKQPDVKTKITLNDIAILAQKNRQLDDMQFHLQRVGIPVKRAQKSSVFVSEAAQEIGAILQAIAVPDYEQNLKRALISPLIGYSLSDLTAQNIDTRISHEMSVFRDVREKWQQSGFLMAWQAIATHYRIWQHIAELSGPRTERMIVNVRHLIEILSQRSHHMGMDHLIHWYQLQLGAPLQREWEMERPLVSDNGVELMTIHQSKGLEFKILFVMGGNHAGSSQSQLGFFLHQQDDGQLIRGLTPALQRLDEQALAQHQARIEGEEHRLWYVALTRASYMIYVYLNQSDYESSSGLDYWLKAKQRKADFVPKIAPLPVANIKYQAKANVIAQLEADDYPHQQFYARTQTSFTALTHDKNAHVTDHFALAPATNKSDDEGETHTSLDNFASNDYSQAAQSSGFIAEICQKFPGGTRGGNCLHELLEHLDLNAQPDTSTWSTSIERILTKHNIWSSLLTNPADAVFAEDKHAKQTKQDVIHAIARWMSAVVNAPLLLNKDDTIQDETLQTERSPSCCLGHIPARHRQAEMKFAMSLKDENFDSSKITRLFKELEKMDMNKAVYSARYLTGAIDLVFYHNGQYHVADYKSNHLGIMLEDYQPTKIYQNMINQKYILQAAIYLVALHRYLKQRIRDYDIKQHLGSAYYLYLRGMHAEQSPSENGVYGWRPSDELILTLDQTLGYFHQ